MTVEILIYAYLIICTSMIVFSTVSIFLFYAGDKQVEKTSQSLVFEITEQLERITHGIRIEEDHLDYLVYKLKNVSNLRSFDYALDALREQKSETVEKYFDLITPVFGRLMDLYIGRSEVFLIFYLYILKKYLILKRRTDRRLSMTILTLISSPSTYCRESALQVIYSSGNVDLVIKALNKLGQSGFFHNEKLISDGLLSFNGNREELCDKLWASLENFSTNMQVAILNHFRFNGDSHAERMLHIMTSEEYHYELRFAAIRYFGKYFHIEAREYLLHLADSVNNLRWEYNAIAALALAIYPGEDTFNLLKNNLRSDNWHIRYNSAQSMQTLGFEYLDVADIFEGTDRYAREILQYHIDRRRVKQEVEL